MIVLLKMRASDKIFDKICLKATTSFSNMWPVIKGQGDSIFWWGWYLTEAESWNFWLAGRSPKFPPLVGHPDLPTKKTLRRVLDTVMILKRVNESIFFQINKFTACKITKEVANSLMAFNLLKIIHPFQDKKHLRT